MKRNDITQLATLTQAKLQEKLQVINLELSRARLAKAAGKLANLRSVSTLKDDVARIKTVLRQIQLEPPEAVVAPEVEAVSEVEAVEPKAKKVTKKIETKKVSKTKTE